MLSVLVYCYCINNFVYVSKRTSNPSQQSYQLILDPNRLAADVSYTPPDASIVGGILSKVHFDKDVTVSYKFKLTSVKEQIAAQSFVKH